VCAIDAWFKLQPYFINNFIGYLTGSQQAAGQPAWVQSWIDLWINVVSVDPHVFAHLVAIGETAVAVALLFGMLTNLASLVGISLAIVIWTTAESLAAHIRPAPAISARRSSTCSSSLA
jgi:uncharacterized membrane protein YphA (DoxX/SURF4 family)